eukprot:119747-Prymnesium_polylepis.1
MRLQKALPSGWGGVRLQIADCGGAAAGACGRLAQNAECRLQNVIWLQRSQDHRQISECRMPRGWPG